MTEHWARPVAEAVMMAFNPAESRTSRRTIRFALLASVVFLLAAILAIRVVA